MMEIKLYHKTFLSHVKSFIEELYFSLSCDYDTEVNDYYVLDTLFNISKILLWNVNINNKIKKVNPEYDWYDKKAYYEKEYYIIKYKNVSKVIEYLLSELIDYSISYRDKMMETFIYWICKDLEYYQFVLSYDLKKEFITDYSAFDKFCPLRDFVVNEIIDNQIKKT